MKDIIESKNQIEWVKIWKYKKEIAFDLMVKTHYNTLKRQEEKDELELSQMYFRKFICFNSYFIKKSIII